MSLTLRTPPLSLRDISPKGGDIEANSVSKLGPPPLKGEGDRGAGFSVHKYTCQSKLCAYNRLLRYYPLKAANSVRKCDCDFKRFPSLKGEGDALFPFRYRITEGE